MNNNKHINSTELNVKIFLVVRKISIIKNININVFPYEHNFKYNKPKKSTFY